MDTNAKLETFRDEFVLLSNSRPPPVTWAGDTPLPITPTSRPTSFTVRSRLARRFPGILFGYTSDVYAILARQCHVVGI
jgi:hypothetical protein